LSTAAAKTTASKEGFNQPFFEKQIAFHPPNRDTKSQATRGTQITDQLMRCASQQQQQQQQQQEEATFPKKEECKVVM
jgi:hypothetical protein